MIITHNLMKATQTYYIKNKYSRKMNNSWLKI